MIPSIELARPPLSTVALENGGEVSVLRLDALHHITGGNKIYKMWRNLIAASSQGCKTIATFGGSSSNHLAAAAQLCADHGFFSIGVVRGENRRSATIDFLLSRGMQLEFVTRSQYQRRNSPSLKEDLEKRYGPVFLVPEGGANAEGVAGCREILTGITEYDYVVCACGTATTFAGLLLSRHAKARVVGINVLKGPNRLPEAAAALSGLPVAGDEALQDRVITRDCIISGYAFGGYACFDPQLLAFQRRFEKCSGIILDYIYTSKLFFAVNDLRSRGLLPGRVLVIHSGGLQGNADFEVRYHTQLQG